MKFLKEAVYSEKYKTKEGEEKTKYTNIGALFEREDGSLCAKILGTWVSFYDKKAPKEVDSHNTAKANAYQPDVDLGEELPF